MIKFIRDVTKKNFHVNLNVRLMYNTESGTTLTTETKTLKMIFNKMTSIDFKSNKQTHFLF